MVGRAMSGRECGGGGVGSKEDKGDHKRVIEYCG